MNARNILYIIPPYFNIQDYITKNQKHFLPAFEIPYGVLSIDSYIKHKSKYNMHTSLIDLNIEVSSLLNKNSNKFIDIKRIIYNYLNNSIIKFDIVAISALFNSCYNYIEDILSLTKDVNKNKPPLVVMGGGLASNLYKRILLDFPLIDGLCYAEGEIPMLDLINSDNYIELMDNHPSWITRKSLKDGMSPSPSYVKNLDDIPSLSYELVDINKYNSRSTSLYSKNNSESRFKKELPIHTSRGCPFHCVYCASGTLHGNEIRYMSIEKVLYEIDLMIDKFKINTLLIEDDHFLGDKKRAIKILKELTRKNIKLFFPNGLAVYAIDEEVGQLLKLAGAETVELAVESGSEYVLKNLINKPLNKNDIKHAVEILRKNDIRIHAFIVIGIPGETDKHRTETLQMIKETGFDWVRFFIAIPVVGSRLYDICIDNNYITDTDFRNHIVNKGTISAPGVNPEEIVKISYLMNLETNFLFNYNILNKKYEIAIIYFRNVIKKYPNHAFAYYALSKCYNLMGKNHDLAEKYSLKFREIIQKDMEWYSYACHFGLIN